VLFDEIEKAHPEVFHILLQILEDGRLTDAQGRTVDFRNCVVIMTSNLGAKQITKQGGGLGFTLEGDSAQGVQDQEKIKEAVMSELKRTLRPEFLNRVDDIVVFHQLDRAQISQIAARMLLLVGDRLAEQDIHVEFDASITDRMAEAGFDPVYGARPLRRAIQTQVEDTLSERLLDGSLKVGKRYVCRVEDGEIVAEEPAEES